MAFIATKSSALARSIILLPFGLLLSVTACSQDAGESCQRDRDCASGLECTIPTGFERGTCEDPSAREMGTGTQGDFADAAVPIDAGDDDVDVSDAAAADEDGGGQDADDNDAG